MSVTVGRAPRGGELVDRGRDQAAVLVGAQVPGQDPAGDRDGQLGRLLPELDQRVVACRGNVAFGAVPRKIGLGLRLVDDLFARRLRRAPRLVEQGADLVLGLGHEPAMLGKETLGLVPRSLGVVQDVFEVHLALVQRLEERLPGEPAQHQEQPNEDDNRPDRQRGLRLENVGLRRGFVTGGGMRRLVALAKGGRRPGSRKKRGHGQSQGQNQLPGHGNLDLVSSGLR